ncbi:hypothetical protein ACWCXB_34665 [Streptomyces sp. NPDC001514]
MSTRTRTSPAGYTLGLGDISRIEAILDELSRIGDDPGGERFYERRWELAANLPDGLRRFLHEFRSTEGSAAALIHGLPVDDSRLGPTPPAGARPPTRPRDAGRSTFWRWWAWRLESRTPGPRSRTAG